MSKKKPITVWVIMHYEVFENQIDCLQFHVSSSLKKAEAYFRVHHVAPYSWWQVHPYVIDHDITKDGWEGDEVYYYSYRGTKLKKAPFNQVKAAFEREQKKREILTPSISSCQDAPSQNDSSIH
jgi:hypothetical protein